MCIYEVAHTLRNLPDVLPIQSDGFIIRVFSVPDLLDFVFCDLIIDLILSAPLRDLLFIPSPHHVVDFLIQHPFHLREVVAASSCPSLKRLLSLNLLLENIKSHQACQFKTAFLFISSWRIHS